MTVNKMIVKRINVKNPSPFVMKQLLHITASLDQPEFVQDLVEQLAYRHNDLGFGKIKLPTGWIALDTSSTETYVSGNMDISGDDATADEQIHMPFITSFLFTCIKGGKEPYQLNWSSSLS